jgi:hypothetical protein
MAIIRFETFNAKSLWPVDNTLEKAELAARAKCDAEHGEWIGGHQDGQEGLTIFTWHTHVGLCVSDREMNGYNDSDWYMLVFDPETESFHEICFASTRGWTYPAYGSKPDATPEVMAKYAAHLATLAKAAQEAHERIADVTPEVGKRVEVIKGRKVPKGTTGLVFWKGAGTKYSPNFGYSKHLIVPDRLGIRDANGTAHWTSAANVMVI